jgi:hypothetical protein
LHTIAADVAAQIDEPAHFVGHAFGNRVAVALRWTVPISCAA